MSDLFDNTVGVLSKSMDMYLQRHAIISDNIANADTPFFKARRLDFESELQRAVESSESFGEEAVKRSLASFSPVIREETNSERGQDMNTVDMDREMAALTKNDVKYASATQMISKKFALLKYAITEGADR